MTRYNQNELDILGFFTIAPSSVQLIDDDGKPIVMPAYELMQIARNSKTSKANCPGSYLLQEAEKILYQVCDQVGGNVIFLDCWFKQGLVDFYGKYFYVLTDAVMDPSGRLIARLVKRI